MALFCRFLAKLSLQKLSFVLPYQFSIVLLPFINDAFCSLFDIFPILFLSNVHLAKLQIFLYFLYQFNHFSTLAVIRSDNCYSLADLVYINLSGILLFLLYCLNEFHFLRHLGKSHVTKFLFEFLMILP